MAKVLVNFHKLLSLKPQAVTLPKSRNELGAPAHIPSSGAGSFFVSGSSVIVASVSNKTLATEMAFSSAMRTTLVGQRKKG